MLLAGILYSAITEDGRRGNVSRGVSSRDIVYPGKRASRVQHSEAQYLDFQDEGPNMQQTVESSKQRAETLRRLPTHTAGGKTLMLKAIPKRSPSSQNFVQRVGTPGVSCSIGEEARDRKVLQHAVELGKQHRQPKLGYPLFHSEPPKLLSGEAPTTPQSQGEVSRPPDYLPGTTSLGSGGFESGRAQPRSDSSVAVQKTAPRVGETTLPSTYFSTMQIPSRTSSVLGSNREGVPKQPLSRKLSYVSTLQTPVKARTQRQAPMYSPPMPTAKDIKVNVADSRPLQSSVLWGGLFVLSKGLLCVLVHFDLRAARRRKQFGFKPCGGATK